jgi:hypothetical protein
VYTRVMPILVPSSAGVMVFSQLSVVSCQLSVAGTRLISSN